MIDIIFWIIGLSLFTLSFTWRLRKSELINAIGLLAAVLFFYGVFLLFKTSLLTDTKAPFVLGLLPLNLLILWFASSMYYLGSKINAAQIDEITSGPGMYGILFLAGYSSSLEHYFLDTVNFKY